MRMVAAAPWITCLRAPDDGEKPPDQEALRPNLVRLSKLLASVANVLASGGHRARGNVELADLTCTVHSSLAKTSTQN
jgi:hypothetical protein